MQIRPNTALLEKKNVKHLRNKKKTATFAPHLRKRMFPIVLRIVLWCNGSTRVFGSLSPSSNLGRTTKNNTKTYCLDL